MTWSTVNEESGSMVRECELLPNCLFFAVDMHPSMSPMKAVLKDIYCLTKHDTCARYMVARAMGSDKVPSDLFLTQTERAEAIIKKG